ncbi:hypothetical protein L5W98_002325 [Salmonella enterica]|uniref:hypothetical protein n=1 Tax=Salmonella enterica TaxID=28901 RepID=UPI001078CF88|nr:hypothetical protein [Salmonella enterica]EAB6425779.1 hypothetical protein [Salmonella enterica subsp. enterica serovar Amsterdam]EAM5213804.1 hypothetical protein [Salmonella enterica]EAN3954672.1 hypothetical protein [Salmonella enterica]EAN6003970.1 hypothetical protein [Salmonella enterica]EAP4733017.1 hypothetical protein [Salmonella enterica]
MLDSLPDAALPFWAYKSRCLKIGRKWRRQIIHGLRAATGAYIEYVRIIRFAHPFGAALKCVQNAMRFMRAQPGIKLASKLARNPAKKKSQQKLAKIILEAM